MQTSPARAILRIVLVVVGVVLTLYVIYLLRRPLTWLVIAAFLAVALAGPVGFLSRRMKRGLAIAIVYLGVVLVPLLLGALMIPPMVGQAKELVDRAPAYAEDVTDFVNRNETLRDLESEYDITGELQDQARKLPGKLGSAAGTVQDIGVGVINSIFATVTILILSLFMVAGGRRWIDGALELQPPDRAERMRRTLDRISVAVGNYVGGALLQAAIAGVLAFIVLKILGVPFAAPLAVVVFLFDLIPVVGATIASVLVALVVLFVNFPIGLFVWVAWAVVYQQLENYVIQPQIQRRAVEVQPFVVLVSVLFGSTLFGVAGAILAVPFAASVQIALSEWWRQGRELENGDAASGQPPAADAPPPPTPPPAGPVAGEAPG